MSPKIVFAALLFCSILLGLGNARIVPRPTPSDSYESYPSDSYDSNDYISYPSNNYYVAEPTIQWLSFNRPPCY